jgi:hypothetical protein
VLSGKGKNIRGQEYCAEQSPGYDFANRRRTGLGKCRRGFLEAYHRTWSLANASGYRSMAAPRSVKIDPETGEHAPAMNSASLAGNMARRWTSAMYEIDRERGNGAAGCSLTLVRAPGASPFGTNAVRVVPEPGSLVLVLVGLVSLMRSRRRPRQPSTSGQLQNSRVGYGAVAPRTCG